MIDPAKFDPVAYVTAAAPAMGLSFTPERVQIVAEALALVVRIGARLFDSSVKSRLQRLQYAMKGAV